MNIFILDTNPTTAARMHCDKHVPKMCVEAAQMLASALRLMSKCHSPKQVRPTRVATLTTHAQYGLATVLATFNGLLITPLHCSHNTKEDSVKDMLASIR